MKIKYDIEKSKEYFDAKKMFTLGPHELQDKISKKEDIVIVDVRYAEDYKKGHIPDAINLSMGTWDKAGDFLKKEKLHIVYCYTQQCHLAAFACSKFASMGYPVMELEGGFETWGGEVVK